MNLNELPEEAVRDGGIYALVHQQESWGEILSAFGELDLSVADEFTVAIDAQLAGPRPLVLDFEYCNYVDSTILSVLVRAARGNRNRLGIIVPAQARIRRVFEMTGLDEALAVLNSREEARDRFTPSV